MLFAVVGSVPSPNQLKWRCTITKRKGTKIDQFLLIRIDFAWLPRNLRKLKSFIAISVENIARSGARARDVGGNKGLVMEPPELGNFSNYFLKIKHF